MSFMVVVWYYPKNYVASKIKKEWRQLKNVLQLHTYNLLLAFMSFSTRGNKKNANPTEFRVKSKYIEVSREHGIT